MTHLRFLAVDETDRMVEKGHFDELEKILKLLRRYDGSIIGLSPHIELDVYQVMGTTHRDRSSSSLPR